MLVQQAIGREIGMEHDLLLRRRNGSAKYFRIYGRSTPNVGEIVTLPIDRELIKARISDPWCVASPRAEKVVDHIDTAEFEEV